MKFILTLDPTPEEARLISKLREEGFTITAKLDGSSRGHIGYIEACWEDQMARMEGDNINDIVRAIIYEILYRGENANYEVDKIFSLCEEAGFEIEFTNLDIKNLRKETPILQYVRMQKKRKLNELGGLYNVFKTSDGREVVAKDLVEASFLLFQEAIFFSPEALFQELARRGQYEVNFVLEDGVTRKFRLASQYTAVGDSSQRHWILSSAEGIHDEQS